MALSAFPFLSAWLLLPDCRTRKSSSSHFEKLQSILPTAIKIDIAAAIQEIATVLFF